MRCREYDGLALQLWRTGAGWGAAASKRATCLPRRGNVGTEGPTHDATVQDAPPQNPVLPIEVGSIGQPPELAPLRQLRGTARVPQHIYGVIVGSSV